MNNTEIIATIRELGYPSNLEDSEIVAAITYVLRELNKKHPLMALGTFNLVACQQEYDLFNPVPFEATSQGVFPNGLRAYEIIWNADLSGDNASVFGLAPFLQGSAGQPFLGLTSAYSFFTPGDWVIWDEDWAALMHRFSPCAFEAVTDAPGAPIIVYPVPLADCQAILRFTRDRTESDLRDEDESWFIKLVEGRCARTLANKISFCAGVSVAEVIRNDGKTLSYWNAQADNLWAAGWDLFDRNRHEQVPSVQRTHGP